MKKRDWALTTVFNALIIGVVVRLYLHAKATLWVEPTAAHYGVWDTMSPALQAKACAMMRGLDCPPQWGHVILVGGFFGVPLLIFGVMLFWATEQELKCL